MLHARNAGLHPGVEGTGVHRLPAHVPCVGDRGTAGPQQVHRQLSERPGGLFTLAFPLKPQCVVNTMTVLMLSAWRAYTILQQPLHCCASVNLHQMYAAARGSLSCKSAVPVQAAQAAGKWLIEKFVIHGLVAAVALPMTLMSVSSLIDSQWTVVSLVKPSLTLQRPALASVSCVLEDVQLQRLPLHVLPRSS